MKGIVTILCALCFMASHAQNKLGPIGQWRGHFNNQSIEHVVNGGQYIYTASPYQVIRIDNKKNNYWIDKSNGLSDINISRLAWDENQQQLVIVYKNSNIDILKDDQVYNINAIQLTNLFSDKKINSVHIQNRWALLATNFGIVIVDLINHEVKDNWYPNNNQQSTVTYDVLIANDSVYAATSDGIWASSYNAAAIQAGQWNRLKNYDQLAIKKLIQFNGSIYGYNGQSIFQLPQTTPIFTISNGQINQINASSNHLNISVQYANQKGAILQFSKDKITSTLIDSNVLRVPKQIVIDLNNHWVADSVNGLLLKNSTQEWMNLGGPNANMKAYGTTGENELIMPFGAMVNGFSKFDASGWKNYTQFDSFQLPVLNAVTFNKNDNSYWFTSNQSIIHITNENKLVSTQPKFLAGAYQQIQTQLNGDVWVLQDLQGLLQIKNNIWNTIPLPNNFNNKGLKHFIINEQGQAWIVAPNNQGLYIYQDKSVYSNEVWKQLTTQSNNGNLPSTNVSSICKDANNSIWVGTDNGIGIYNCGDLATDPCNAYLPIVNNNGFNGYLFQKETVNSISIDGANRKWIGTNNGAWLLSADGTEIIEHFTKSNSPLPSDTISQILVQPNTGEVFINTVNQMVSYRSNATQGKATQASIQIFPNPVATGFNGQIAMRGLVENALVKITDLNGKLLFQTRALGGQALWNGKNYEGQKVATGIYLVFVRDLSGNEKSVGKIVIAEGY